MTSGQIFKYNSRFNSRLISSLPEKDVVSANWLLRVLPDFGIVQLEGRRVDSIVAQFEQLIDTPLIRWNSTEQFASYAELLVVVLAFSSADHVYLQHSLRVWAEKGGVLWILVEADLIPNELLIQLLRYRPLSRSGQYSIRILLKVSDGKLHDKSFAPLADVIHERVGEPVPVKHGLFNHRVFKACTPYVVVLFLSAASIAATLYVASQEKLALVKIEASDTAGQDIVARDLEARGLEASDQVLQLAMPESRSIETLSAVQAPPEMITPVSQVESLSHSGKSEAITLIERWSRAWQQQNIDEYFSMYGDGYSAYRRMSSNEWRLRRTARLEKPDWISIEIGPVAIEQGAEGELHATFWQLYRSPGYQDDTLKTLVLRQEAGIWKITDEINKEVRPLSQE